MAIRGFHWQMISRLMQTVWAWAANSDHRDRPRVGSNAESSNPKTPGQYRGNVGLKSHFGS